MRRTLAIAAVAAGSLLLTAAARAADVISPADGTTVSSRPDFTVDYPQGTLAVELATTPETLTVGDHVGQFVEPARTNFMLIGTVGGPPGVAQWGLSPRLNAGHYFWHVQPNDYATEAARGFIAPPWGATRTLTVRDEPIVFEGWTLRARRTSRSACKPRFRRAYQLTGTIVWSDNTAAPAARYAITLRNGASKAVLKGNLAASPGRFTNVVCTNHTAAAVTVTLRDQAGASKDLLLR
jgi:hypothetical protein